MKKEEIDRQIAAIDAEVKKTTGVDLAKLAKQIEDTRQKAKFFDLVPIALQGDIYLVKNRIASKIF